MSAFARASQDAVQFALEAAAARGPQGQALAARHHEALRTLSRDDAFSALLVLVNAHREQYVRAAAQQSLAAHQGSLQHCCGSIYALDTLLEQIREICVTEPVKRARKQAGVKGDSIE